MQRNETYTGFIQFTVDVRGKLWRSYGTWLPLRLHNCDCYFNSKRGKTSTERYQLVRKLAKRHGVSPVIHGDRVLSCESSPVPDAPKLKHDKNHVQIHTCKKYDCNVESPNLVKVLTEEGRIFSIRSMKIIDERPIFTHIAEMKCGTCFKLDVDGNLHLEDQIILDEVEYLAPMFKNGYILKRKGEWMCKINFIDRCYSKIHGLLPYERVLHKKFSVFYLESGAYTVRIYDGMIHSTSIDPVNRGEKVVDACYCGEVLYYLTDAGKIYRVKGNKTEIIEPALIEYIHRSDPIVGFHIFCVIPTISTRSGKLFYFLDGVSQLHGYPEEMMRIADA
jgi:hypothetical protein